MVLTSEKYELSTSAQIRVIKGLLLRFRLRLEHRLKLRLRFKFGIKSRFNYPSLNNWFHLPNSPTLNIHYHFNAESPTVRSKYSMSQASYITTFL